MEHARVTSVDPSFIGQCVERGVMLRWAIIFLVIALIAGFLGFSDVELVSATIAQILFGVFLLGFVIIVVVGFFLGSWTRR